MRKQIQALGRLKTGQMNKTESAYCQHLERVNVQGKSPGIGSRVSSCGWLTTRFIRPISL